MKFSNNIDDEWQISHKSYSNGQLLRNLLEEQGFSSIEGVGDKSGYYYKQKGEKRIRWSWYSPNICIKHIAKNILTPKQESYEIY